MAAQEVILFPDAVGVSILYLKAALAAAGDTTTHIGTNITDAARQVRLELADAHIHSYVVQRSTIKVEIRTDDEPAAQEDAQDLAQLVRGLLGSMQGTVQAGATIYDVTDTVVPGLADQPDPITAKARYVFAIEIAMRGTATLDDSTIVTIPDWLRPQPRIVQLVVTDPHGAPITIGAGKAYFRVNARLDGWQLAAVAAALRIPSVAGTPSVQITNLTQAVPMLSTELTIDPGETDSSTGSAAVIANPTVDEADELSIDITAAGTGAVGLIVELTFTP